MGGEARQAILGLTLSNENYKVAISILKERFGNIQHVIDLHYSEMINLQSAPNKTSSLRTFLDKLNRHLRSLEVLKQDVNLHVFVSIFKSKLPEEVLLQLEIQKGSKEKWSIQKLCDKLCDYVVARENSERKDSQKDHYNNSNRNQYSRSEPKHWQKKSFTLFIGNRGSQHSNAGQALVVASDDKTGSATYFDKCRYCQQQHWSDECPKYRSIEERKRLLKGSCYKCLKYGHRSDDCKRGKICVHCNERDSHHRSLCPKRFKVKISIVFIIFQKKVLIIPLESVPIH